MNSVVPGTRPVAPQHAFDTGRLAAWIEATVGPQDGPVEVAQFKGGQSNPTYLVTTGSRRYVLRRKPRAAGGGVFVLGGVLPIAWFVVSRSRRLRPAAAAHPAGAKSARDEVYRRALHERGEARPLLDR